MDPRKQSPGRIARRVTRSREFLSQDIWSPELSGLPTFRAMGYRITRVVYLALRGFNEHRCMYRASALTYITILSIVPLLAFAFSVAKGLGAYDRLVNQAIYPFLDSTFGPSTSSALASDASAAVHGGAEVRHAIDQVLLFVRETNFSSLGLFGLAVLLYAVIKLCSSVENALNGIWGVHKSRTLLRKLSDYLSMVVVVPILLVTATGISAAIRGSGGPLQADTSSLAPALRFFLRVSPLLALWVGFSLVYLFMPNTRTRVRSALIGGVIGGALWHLLQLGHVRFQLGVANYNAIYASFAALPIFMVWVYFSWVTLLVGAEFAFAHQNEPTFREIARARHHDHAFREILALRLVARTGELFLAGEGPANTVDLAVDLGVPEFSIVELASTLAEAEVLAVLETEDATTLLPARGLGQIRIKHILDALKGMPGAGDVQVDEAFERITERALREYGEEMERSAFNLSIRELLDQSVDTGEAEDPGLLASG